MSQAKSLQDLLAEKKLVHARNLLREKRGSGARVYGLDQRLEQLEAELQRARQRVGQAVELMGRRQLASAAKALEVARRQVVDLPEALRVARTLREQQEELRLQQHRREAAVASEDFDAALIHAQAAAELNLEDDGPQRLAELQALVDQRNAAGRDRKLLVRGLGAGLLVAVLMGAGIVTWSKGAEGGREARRAVVDEAWAEVGRADQLIREQEYEEADGVLAGVEQRNGRVLDETPMLAQGIAERRGSVAMREGLAGKVLHRGRWMTPDEREADREAATDLLTKNEAFAAQVQQRLDGQMPEVVPLTDRVAKTRYAGLLVEVAAISGLLERGELESAQERYRLAEATLETLFRESGLILFEEHWVSPSLLQARQERERREAQLAAEQERREAQLAAERQRQEQARAEADRRRRAEEADAIREREAQAERARQAQRDREAAARAAEQLNNTAYLMAIDFVRDSLKAPATARFSSRQSSSTRIQYSASDGQYRVSGHVDAQNSYGATIRNNFVVEVWPDPRRPGYWRGTTPLLY